MSRVLFIFVWLLFGFILPQRAPDAFDGWNTLAKLELVAGYDEFLGEPTELPVFSDELKAFDGEVITVEGYVIPLEQAVEQSYFVLSRFPFNNCFFCGNAGPETVAEVYTKEKFTVQDTRVRVTGKLELNANDPLHLFFIVSEAKVEKL